MDPSVAWAATSAGFRGHEPGSHAANPSRRDRVAASGVITVRSKYDAPSDHHQRAGGDRQEGAEGPPRRLRSSPSRPTSPSSPRASRTGWWRALRSMRCSPRRSASPMRIARGRSPSSDSASARAELREEGRLRRRGAHRPRARGPTASRACGRADSGVAEHVAAEVVRGFEDGRGADGAGHRPRHEAPRELVGDLGARLFELAIGLVALGLRPMAGRVVADARGQLDGVGELYDVIAGARRKGARLRRSNHGASSVKERTTTKMSRVAGDEPIDAGMRRSFCNMTYCRSRAAVASACVGSRQTCSSRSGAPASMLRTVSPTIAWSSTRRTACAVTAAPARPGRPTRRCGRAEELFCRVELACRAWHPVVCPPPSSTSPVPSRLCVGREPSQSTRRRRRVLAARPIEIA